MDPTQQAAKPVKKRRGFHIFGGFFTFRIIPALITVVLVGCMIALGFWQLERREWKNNLIAKMHDRLELNEIDLGLSSILPETIPQLDYHPGRAEGRLLHDKPLYLNATSIGTGQGGYHILVPMQLDDGRYLLVDRGWMPYSLKDKFDGDSPQTRLHQLKGNITISGILRLPPVKKPTMRPENDTGKNNWYWVDLAAMASATGTREFQPYYMEAFDYPHEGAYPVGSQTRIEMPNHHMEYAITWFWLAFILPVIYLVSSWRLIRKEKPIPAEGDDAAEKKE